MATSWSLLEFHHIPSNCSSNSTDTASDGDDDEDDLWSSIRTSSDDTDGAQSGEVVAPGEPLSGEEDGQDADTATAKASTKAGGKKKEDDRSNHPYVVTRYASHAAS
jgi:hypothetical protein